LNLLFAAQIGLGLVCEFLEYYGFQYTLSVLLPEANLVCNKTERNIQLYVGRLILIFYLTGRAARVARA
jgi:hypothetical protein